jgi:hypothetical protein
MFSAFNYTENHAEPNIRNIFPQEEEEEEKSNELRLELPVE